MPSALILVTTHLAKAEQIRAIQVSRFVTCPARLERDALERIEEAIRITRALI
jgi:mRNA-degrading endonuclease toxin of MazEF toxin-antitoxin module